jgi:hypothetical protein
VYPATSAPSTTNGAIGSRFIGGLQGAIPEVIALAWGLGLRLGT